jgi:PIN domain nuclease of toxin-antitoxin system
MIVLDTHVVVWWVSGAARISSRAARAIRAALRAGPVVASTISIFEIANAARRGRLSLNQPLDDWLEALCTLPELRFEPLGVDIAKRAGGLGEAIPCDPADRIIVATAMTLGAKLVTADERLAKLPIVQVVW